MGWLSVLCKDEVVENGSLSLSEKFDRMMESFAGMLQQARDGERCDIEAISHQFEQMRAPAGKLSATLRLVIVAAIVPGSSFASHIHMMAAGVIGVFYAALVLAVAYQVFRGWGEEGEADENAVMQDPGAVAGQLLAGE